MRLIKMLGLAAIAVGAFMAYVGASSAMAVTSLEKVVLCKEDPVSGTCPAAKELGQGSNIHMDLVPNTKAELLSSLGNVVCTVSSSEAEVKEILALGLLRKLGTKKLYENCTLGVTPCTVTEASLPYLWQALLVNDDTKYHVVVSSDGDGAPAVRFECGFTLSCSFVWTAMLFEYVLASSVLKVNQAPSAVSGTFCPGTSTLEIQYFMTCLTPGGVSTSCWLAMEEA